MPDDTQRLSIRPTHVPESLVFDFDLYNVEGGDVNPQAGYFAMQQSRPDIFWTPRNGGHWVATRATDIDKILRDPVRFSSARVLLPRDDDTPQSPPIETDPPRHTALRKPLNRALFPKVVDAMESGVRELAISLIESVKPAGGCEFISAFAQVYPLSIFLDLVDLPRDERLHILPMAEQFIKGGTVEIRRAAQMELYKYIQSTVQKRRANPGDDLASAIVNCEVDGARIDEDEATAYLTLVLFAGQDTVVGVLSYIAESLARNPSQRRELVANLHDAAFMRGAIEEFLRRFGVVSTARVVTEDLQVAGAQLRQGDMLFPVSLLAGLDDRHFENPLEINFHRPAPIRHAAFGAGPHACPGALLARRELKIFLEEWLGRIPEFEIKPGTRPLNTMGLSCSLSELQIIW